MKSKVTYSIMVNCASDTKNNERWVDWYDLLSEEDARIVATFYFNMKKNRFDKLANHTSKKFIHMRTRKVWVTKNIHSEEVEEISFETQLNNMIKEQLKDLQ